ncbi:hypothetical protein JQ597_21070 [Bradyrhizobium sp. AUGA SZCCT0177]|uniref:hypothetical protein n=1 Tax=Bradyrhizobium sp. AUGA SZCCT0177 TaxID=2807665 RepID=UPI001BAE262D|nr:hypothetical protein [Bradyrhizobium sp. AUGA SZCCT0177]MBR1284544.1 hypothetical protein [Bradyrhizobium sp. AUGA SZCCT0177]
MFAMAGAIAMMGLAQATDALAQQARPDLVDPVHRGYYKRPGPGFACVIGPSEKLSPEQIKALSEHACMRIGPLVVGMAAAAVKSALGQPSRQIEGPKGTTVWVHFLGNANEEPYLLASIWKDRLVAIQVTGRSPADKYGFNGLTLGATADNVTKQLGKPMLVGPSSQPNTDVWSYKPWTFSIEMSGGRVTSIRVADPQFD